MDFELTDVQRAWQEKAAALGADLTDAAAPADVVLGAARVGVLDPQADLLAVAVAVEALAEHAGGAGLALALHSSVLLSVGGDDRFTSLVRGEAVGAVGLSSDDVATGSEGEGRLSGRASWVAPLTDRGLAIVGARREPATGEVSACMVALDAPGVTLEVVATAALRGCVCGHVSFDDVTCIELGRPLPIMARVRVLLAAAGLGMGRRALAEALTSARGQKHRGAAGEQTVQGLLADAATELDAARLLTWQAASADTLTLAAASMAKLAVTDATQRAVTRATQVVGAETLRQGHAVERLAQDVRALELFAGRTEALREAVAEEILPRV